MGSSIDWSDFYPVRQAREEGFREGFMEGFIKETFKVLKMSFDIRQEAGSEEAVELVAKKLGISAKELKQKIEEWGQKCLEQTLKDRRQ